MTKYVEDNQYLDTIIKQHKCPYCQYPLQKPYPYKRQCGSCDFELYGNPKYCNYKIFEPPVEYTFDINRCVECGNELFYDDEDKILVCPKCGLVHTGQHQYVGGRRVIYPFGLHTENNFFI